MAWVGNKREETEEIYKIIGPIIDKYDLIIEPFAGSQAISYYISLQVENKKYILNDNNKFLKDMFNIMKDDERITQFNNDINELYFNNLKFDKEKYSQFVKDDNIFAWFIANKFYNMRPGLWPNLRNFSKVDLKNTGIYEFYKKNKIVFTCEDGVEIYKKYKDNEKALLILDPPYLSTSNDYYLDSDANIYEYIYKNNISNEKAGIMFILEDIWIIRLLFNNNSIVEYDKSYNGFKKKKVKHLIIHNF